MLSDTVHVKTNVMAQPIAIRLIATPKEILLFTFFSPENAFKRLYFQIFAHADNRSDCAQKRSGNAVYQKDEQTYSIEGNDVEEAEHFPKRGIVGKEREHRVINEPGESPGSRTRKDTDKRTLNEEWQLDKAVGCADVFHY